MLAVIGRLHRQNLRNNSHHTFSHRYHKDDRKASKKWLTKESSEALNSSIVFQIYVRQHFPF